MGFNKILNDFKPKHKIAFLSLCTKSRPYSKSPKWKAFIKEFGNDCDLIVCSNGGIIPQEYWECYPYMTYDAPHTNEKYTKLYCDILYERLKKFFEKHHYDKIIFNFRPNLRNRISANEFIKTDIAKQSEIYILPTEEVYYNSKSKGFSRGNMFPDLDEDILNQLKKYIKENKT